MDNTSSDHGGVSSPDNITSFENSPQNTPDNTSPAISAIPETPSEPPKPVDPNTPAIIKSPLGGYITAGGITEVVLTNGVQGTLNDINDEDNFWTAYSDTACYRMPKTPNIPLKDYPPENTPYEYTVPEVIPFLKTKAGDKFGDLTVSKAESSFSSYNNTLQRICLELEGEKTLTGYVTKNLVHGFLLLYQRRYHFSKNCRLKGEFQ